MDRRRLTCLSALLLAALAPAAGARPGPPAVWSSTLTAPRLVAERTGSYVYGATSADALHLTVTLEKLPPQLRLLRIGSTPYRLVAGRATWSLNFPAGEGITNRIAVRVRVAAAARVGSTVCVTLRQVAESGGGVPEVVPKRACAKVQRP
jgi:hypothetical protein